MCLCFVAPKEKRISLLQDGYRLLGDLPEGRRKSEELRRLISCGGKLSLSTDLLNSKYVKDLSYGTRSTTLLKAGKLDLSQ